MQLRLIEPSKSNQRVRFLHEIGEWESELHMEMKNRRIEWFEKEGNSLDWKLTVNYGFFTLNKRFVSSKNTVLILEKLVIFKICISLLISFSFFFHFSYSIGCNFINLVRVKWNFNILVSPYNCHIE